MSLPARRALLPALLLAACTTGQALGPVAGIGRPAVFACGQAAAALDVTIAPETGTTTLRLISPTGQLDRLLPDGPRRFASADHAWSAIGDDTVLTDRRLARTYVCRERGHVGAFGSWWPDPVRS